MKSFSNGPELQEALTTSLVVGENVLYYGVVHTVIDAGPVEGKRIAFYKDLKPQDAGNPDIERVKMLNGLSEVFNGAIK